MSTADRYVKIMGIIQRLMKCRIMRPIQMVYGVLYVTDENGNVEWKPITFHPDDVTTSDEWTGTELKHAGEIFWIDEIKYREIETE